MSSAPRLLPLVTPLLRTCAYYPSPLLSNLLVGFGGGSSWADEVEETYGKHPVVESIYVVGR